MAAPKNNVSYSTFSNDYRYSVVAECKLRMVGKFFKPKPKMTKIRVSFRAKVPLKGVVKMKSYDDLHVFLDFTNEEDYDSVLLKEKVVVAGALMEVSRWTPQFPDQVRETFGIMELDNTKRDEHIGSRNEYGTKKSEAVPENPHIQKDVLYISDSVDCVPEVTHSYSEDRIASHVNCETSEINSSMEISCTGFSGLSPAPNGIAGRISSVTYDSSSRCSTDLVPSVIMNRGPLRGTCLNHNNKKSYSRGWNYGSKLNSEAAEWQPCKALSQPLYALPIVEHHENQKSRPPMEVQYSTYTGYPTVTFSENHRKSLVPKYKLTLIGNFFHRRPKMKEIRVDFSAKNPLNGQVKIRACTCRQILLCFTNEEDYYTILYKKSLFVAGAVMLISWSPDFHHEVKQNIHLDFRCSDASPVNRDTDTSKLHPSIATQNMIARSPHVMDYSSSTCSAYSIPPVVTDGPYRVTSTNHKNKEIVVSHRERPSLELPNTSFPPRSPPRSIGSAIQSMSKLSISDSSKLTQKSVTSVNSAETDVLLNADPHKAIVPTVSVAGRLCPDPSTATDIYVLQSYPNGIVGSPIFGRNEQAGRGSTFPNPSRALDQHILA
ncbi:uncharacterized protein LOC132610296 [Lycium barbarum]|uniref:uncharacterized protein LOC132610296 n=1 Tax=Lycium barbarum TaxID=112863 RepID=UPI00293E64F3|nr:uncharacterized protein LOC132610296 [Lycium barbarum]